MQPSKYNVTCNVYVSCNFLLNNVTRVLCNSYIVEWEITTNIYVTCNIVFAGKLHVSFCTHIRMYTHTRARARKHIYTG